MSMHDDLVLPNSEQKKTNNGIFYYLLYRWRLPRLERHVQATFDTIIAPFKHVQCGIYWRVRFWRDPQASYYNEAH